MNITIVGGGNIGTQFAVHCAEKKHKVVVYTSRPEVFGHRLKIVDEYGNIAHAGEIVLATKNPEDAFSRCDLILVTVPAAMMDSVAETVFRFASETAIIGVVPGNGGSECAFGRCIKRGNVFFGIERVPAIARLIKKGEIVRSTGYRDELHISAIPRSHAKRCSKIIESFFDMPCKEISNYLNLTLTPSNPILHTVRLRRIFQDWRPGMTYEKIPLFYEEWDDASSELLFACDDEVQKICQALPEFNLNKVNSLRSHYESFTIGDMTHKISGILAFKGLPTPTVKNANGYIPDLHSRYFTTDFSYGLSIINQVGNFAGIMTPNISKTLSWYKKIAIEKKEFHYSDYGILDRKSLWEFYSR